MYTKELHNAKLLEILDELIRVCKEQGLTYYLAYGTALGAVRHHGFIPWDDDIDVLMPRKDCEKLYAIRNSVFGKDFKLASYRDDENHLYCMMKLESLTSTLIEHVNPIYVGGVYVDIFPLENVPSEEQDARWTNEVLRIIRSYDMYSVCPPPKTYWVKYLLYSWKRRQWLKKKELFKLDSLMADYSNVETPYVKDYQNDWPQRGLFLREVFGEGVEMEFEGRQCIIPADYDTYLRVSYGDYMQLPPLEKRVQKHDYLFMDSERRLTNEELKPILKDISDKYSYHFNLSWELGRIKDKIGRVIKKFVK